MIRRATILAAALALGGIGAHAQTVIEDFACQVPASATPGNPTVVSCPPPGHGFANTQATGVLQVWGGASSTVTIGNRTYRLVSDLTNCSPGDVRIPTAAEYGNSTNAANANRGNYVAAAIQGAAAAWVVNSSGGYYKANTSGMYCAGTAPHEDVTASSGFSTYVPFVLVRAKAGGPAGELPVSAGTGNSWQYMDRSTALGGTLRRQWRVGVTGATGGWSGIGSAPRIARVLDANRMELIYNSTSAGAFGGQVWTLRRRAWDGQNFTYHNAGDIPGPEEKLNNGTFGIYVQGCTPAETEEACGRAFLSPENQKGYEDWQAISTFSVSGGVGTFTLNGAWPTGGYGTGSMQPGERFYLRGFQKYFYSHAVAGYADNGSGGTRITTATSHNCVATDQANVSGATGDGSPAGAYAISVISATQIDLGGKAFAPGWTGGTLACNPEGRAAQPEAAFYMRNGLRAYKVESRDGLTIQFRTALADGEYRGTCASPAGACSKSSGALPYAATTWLASPYLYYYPRSTTAGSNWFGPIDMLKWHSKNPMPAHTNRLRYWVKWGVDAKRKSSGGYGTNLGTYVVTEATEGTNGRAHFYHYTAANVYSNQWMVYELTGSPSHQVGAAGGTNFPANPTTAPGHGFSPAWGGGADPTWSYFDGGNVQYLDTGGLGEVQSPTFLGYTTTYFGRIEADSKLDEPDDFVRSRTVTWSPRRFIGGVLTDSPGLDVGIEGMAYDAAMRYKVRYSTTQSIRALGWSNAMDGGAAVAILNPGYGYRHATWQSPELSPQPETAYVAIRPIIPIAGATSSGQEKWILLAGNPNLEAGHKVTVSGAGGNRDQADQPIAGSSGWRRWFVDKPADGLTSWLTQQGPLLNVTASGGVCTANLRVEHGLIPGWRIEAAGFTNGALGSTAMSPPNRFTVTAAPSAQSFEFACGGVPDGVYNTSTSSYRANIAALPGVRLEGMAAGDWSGSGTLVSTEENRGFAEVELPRYAETGAPPAAPNGLNASLGGATTVGLSWTDNSTDEAGFVIERKQGINGSWSVIAAPSAGATTYSDAGLTPLTSYTYRIQARNLFGGSEYSAEVSIATDALGHPPAAPSGVTISGLRPTSAVVSWVDNATDELGYAVERDAGAGFEAYAPTAAGVTSLAVADLHPGLSYRFRVKGFNAYGDSAYSAEAAATAPEPLVSGLSIVSGGWAVLHARPGHSLGCSGTFNGPGGGSVTRAESGGYGARAVGFFGLQPDSDYEYVLRCGTRMAWGALRTGAASATGATSVRVTAKRPAGAESLHVDAGQSPGAWTQTVSAPCAGDMCSAIVPANTGEAVWLRRRWCRNSAGDPGCGLATSLVSRSIPEVIGAK